MRNIITLIMCLCSTIVLAQENKIVIKSFEYNETDVTANLGENIVLDNDGEKCALLRIETTQTGFEFDVGRLGVQKVAYKTAEVWVYVPQGVRFITIRHKQLGQSEKYTFPFRLEAACTYNMNILTGKVEVKVEEAFTHQYLVFNVSPNNATVELDDQPLVVENGTAQKFLPYGKYTYRVQAPNYHTSAGVIEVNDTVKQVVDVRLAPAFGWIEVKDTLGVSGAQVYIDGDIVGQIPVLKRELKSGKHKLRVSKPLYKVYEQDFEIQDNLTTTLQPCLTANFATTTFLVNADAEIWINNELKGKRLWTGPLESGTYHVECKQENHRSSTSTQNISSNIKRDTIKLQVPIPILGRMTISSSPSGATIEVDGKRVGETPMLLSSTLIGEHIVRLNKDGYGIAIQNVTVKEGETTNVEAKLSTMQSVTIDANVKAVSIYIDGKYEGITPLTKPLSIGKHQLKLTKITGGYYDYEEEMDITQDKSNYHYELKRSMAQVSIDANRSGALYINGEYKGSVPYSIYLNNGKYNLRVVRKSYKGEKVIVVNGQDVKAYITMKKNHVRRNSFYIEGNYLVGGFTSYGGTMGLYIKNFNFEGSYLMGSSSEDLYWLENNNNISRYGSYSPIAIGGKIGYGIRLGNKIRITPQVGANCIYITNKESDIADGANVISGTGALRISVVLCTGIALSVTPEYSMAISKSEGYKLMSEVNDNIKKWGEGINIRFGLGFFF